MFLCVIGKAFVYKIVKLVVVFLRIFCLVIGVDREKRVLCVLGVLRDSEEGKGIIFVFRRSLVLVIGYSRGFRNVNMFIVYEYKC